MIKQLIAAAALGLTVATVAPAEAGLNDNYQQQESHRTQTEAAERQTCWAGYDKAQFISSNGYEHALESDYNWQLHLRTATRYRVDGGVLYQYDLVGSHGEYACKERRSKLMDTKLYSTDSRGNTLVNQWNVERDELVNYYQSPSGHVFRNVMGYRL